MTGGLEGATGYVACVRTPEELVLVRHGETDWSRTGRHTGRTDVPLADAGREQARAIGRRLAGETYDLVLVSPLGRARETCEIAGLGEAATVVDDLREWDYGLYEGRTTPEIRLERPGWHVFADGCPGGESADQVGRRADRVLASLRGTPGLTRVAVFAHGHLLRVLAARWLGLAGRDGRLMRLDPATISRLGWEHETAVVNSWNA
jgi:broad specificity phosphatase PhoE